MDGQRSCLYARWHEFVSLPSHATAGILTHVTAVRLHRPGTFWKTLYRLSYCAVAFFVWSLAALVVSGFGHRKCLSIWAFFRGLARLGVNLASFSFRLFSPPNTVPWATRLKVRRLNDMISSTPFFQQLKPNKTKLVRERRGEWWMVVSLINVICFS